MGRHEKSGRLYSNVEGVFDFLTQWAKEAIEIVERELEKTGTEILYGDTDGLFVKNSGEKYWIPFEDLKDETLVGDIVLKDEWKFGRRRDDDK